MRTFVSLLSAALVLAACLAPTTPSTATPTVARPSPLVTAVAPSVTPTVAPTAVPATTAPTGPCAARSAGTGGEAQLVAIRVAHQPGFDRVVFDFGSSAMPIYTIESVTKFTAMSNQPVVLIGTAFLNLRFQHASTFGVDGRPTYSGASDIVTDLRLVREVRVIQDFERVMHWGIGLEQQSCGTVSELNGPTRLVLDFVTPLERVTPP